MERPRIYISIPITGRDEARHREYADLMKARLSRSGWRPVSPFEIYAGKKPTYADYICYDLRALADCDAVVMCEGGSGYMSRAMCTRKGLIGYIYVEEPGILFFDLRTSSINTKNQ